MNPKEKSGRKSAANSENKTKGKGKSKGIPAPSQIPPSPSSTNGVVCQPASIGSSSNHALLSPGANSQQAIAQAAVGRGVRHSLGYDPKAIADVQSAAGEGERFMLPTGVEDSLSALTNNYQNSLAEHKLYKESSPDEAPSSSNPYSKQSESPNGDVPTFLSRDSSLIDLAMIPTLDETEEPPGVPGMNFVDFPQPEVNPGLDIDAPDGESEPPSG